MRGTVTMQVTMELLSDTIFGSGFSIPGGEDVAVCKDDRGYPYLKGTTFKGLLRESMENLIAWTGGSENDIAEILGVSGWDGTAEDRRLRLTALTLEALPADPQECYSMRTFTSLEDGMVKPGTLRTAACVRRGLRFVGGMTCASEDVALLQEALTGIKWVGTMRSRGFGRVRVRGAVVSERSKSHTPVKGCCIHYRLHTEAPVLITNLSRSQDNSYETRGYIPGAAVRGMVMNALAAGKPTRFEQNKAVLLSEQTRFLDAVPAPEPMPVLPSIMGFYETKEEKDLESVVIKGEVEPGKKRAKLGTFCALHEDTIHYWSAQTDGAMRIARGTGDGNHSEPFQTRYLCPEQDFSGYILLEDDALAEEISGVFSDTVWLGADRFEGFGKCRVTSLTCVAEPDWIGAYGYSCQEEVGSELYLLAISPLTMLNSLGEPCGIDLASLTEKLGTEVKEIQNCSTSLAEFGGYNRTWKCRMPAMRMYDRGSIFKIKCAAAPALERIQAIQKSGLGVRRAEGFGQVLFLRRALLEGVRRKEPVKQSPHDPTVDSLRNVRDAKFRWVMAHVDEVRHSGLSNSQIGTVQSLCEQAIAMDRKTSDLENYFEKNLTGRGAKHGSRFVEIDALVRQVLNTPLAETLGVPACEDQRLELLCMLFNYSRREKEEV